MRTSATFCKEKLSITTSRSEPKISILNQSNITSTKLCLFPSYTLHVYQCPVLRVQNHEELLRITTESPLPLPELPLISQIPLSELPPRPRKNHKELCQSLQSHKSTLQNHARHCLFCRITHTTSGLRNYHCRITTKPLQNYYVRITGITTPLPLPRWYTEQFQQSV